MLGADTISWLHAAVIPPLGNQNEPFFLSVNVVNEKAADLDTKDCISCRLRKTRQLSAMTDKPR